MRDKQWKQWGGECPRCGSDAQVLTVAGGRYAYDGDEAKCQEDTVEIVAQINGKVRAKLVVSMDIGAEQAIALARAQENVARGIEGMCIVKELYVKGKLVNIVVKPLG